ncbi:hypothetical protein XELAEV_180448902mg, partial [Xenopus laevis]
MSALLLVCLWLGICGHQTGLTTGLTSWAPCT